MENIKKEKQILVENTAKDGLVVLNYDNQLVREMREASRARITTFGLETGADIIAQEINFNYEAGAGVNTNFKVNSGGSLVPINFSALGAPALYAALAATAVGLYYQINLVNIASALADFKQPAGRLRIMPGKNNSILIDDAYNSAPTSVLAALDILANFKTTGRRIAILGSMLELGDLSSKGHRAVGERVAELNLDQLITVGELADEIATAAEESGLAKSKILSFKDSTSASAVLGDFPEAGDVILIKASRGVALDRVVEVLGA